MNEPMTPRAIVPIWPLGCPEHNRSYHSYNRPDISYLLGVASLIADRIYGGHLTILKFTTHYKACFGTPDLSGGTGETQIAEREGFKDLAEALAHIIREHIKMHE